MVKFKQKFVNAPPKNLNVQTASDIKRGKKRLGASRTPVPTGQITPTSPTRANAARLSSSVPTPGLSTPLPGVSEPSQQGGFGGRILEKGKEFISGLEVPGATARAEARAAGEDISFGTLAKSLSEGTTLEERAALEPQVGTAPIIGGTGRVVKAVTKTTKAAKLLKVGKSAAKGASTAENIAVNTASAAKTGNWLGKLALAAGIGTAVGGVIMQMVGSYPFAGFIKEEALQTGSFASKTAIDSGNLDLADEAVAFQEEVLNPELWNQIKNGIPFVNVLNNLDSFYEAAQIKVSVDKKVIADMRANGGSIGTGEGGVSSPADWAARDREKEEGVRTTNQIRIEEQKLYNEFERQAREEQRNEDAAFWRAEDIASIKREREAMEAQALFWLEYRKAIIALDAQAAAAAAKSRADSTPSKLGFGLI